MSRECATLVVMFVMWSSTFVSSEECERREFTAKFTVTCNSPPFSRELDYCIPGQKVNEPCSSDNVCGYCPDGQYQHVYTNCKTCIPCTTLENCSNGQVLIRECESALNAVCGCPRCPEVRCPTQPAVTCPPVPNTTCAPCLPCPTEPDITTTLERTCPPCLAAEEKNPTSPSDDKPFTCPPVEPCPTPECDPLVSSLKDELMLWKIWGIIAAVIILGFLFANILLHCLKKLFAHAHGEPENGNHKQPHRNCADLENQDPDRRACGGEPVGNNQNGNGELLAAGGTKQEVAPNSGNDKNGTNVRVKMPAVGTTKDRGAPNSSQSPLKEDEVHIHSPQVEDGGDEHDGGDEALKPLLKGDKSPAGAEGGISPSALKPLLKGDKSPAGAEGGISPSDCLPLQNIPRNPQNESQTKHPSTSNEPRYVSTTNSNRSEKLENEKLEFARPELGRNYIEEFELDAIADKFYNDYYGPLGMDVDSFLTKLGMDSRYYGKYLMDKKADQANTQIFYVLRKLQSERPLSRNHYLEHLGNISEDFRNWFVVLVNEKYAK